MRREWTAFAIIVFFTDNATCLSTACCTSKYISPFRSKQHTHGRGLEHSIYTRMKPLLSTKSILPKNNDNIAPDDHLVTLGEKTEVVTFPFENPNIALNGFVLAVVVSLLVGNFLTIDSDRWHGWTWTEVALRLLPDSWEAYEHALLVHPITIKAAITAVTYLLGDWLAQGLVLTKERPENGLAWLDIDRIRLLRGLAIGAPLGVLAHFYYDLNEKLLTDYPVWTKIVIDQTLYVGTYNTFYYVGLGLLSGKGISNACADYIEKANDLMIAAWKLWPAVGIITYSVIPLQHRLLWVDFIEIIYSCILSTLANGDESGVVGSTLEIDDTSIESGQNDDLSMISVVDTSIENGHSDDLSMIPMMETTQY